MEGAPKTPESAGEKWQEKATEFLTGAGKDFITMDELDALEDAGKRPPEQTLLLRKFQNIETKVMFFPKEKEEELRTLVRNFVKENPERTEKGYKYGVNYIGDY